MATGVNSVLNIGVGALFASQVAIQTTGNNIANVNTPGYTRQAVRFEEWPALDYRVGQMGQGVLAKEVYRYFDKFLERSYLNTLSDESRWSAQYNQLQSVEALFNESNSNGLSNVMQQFFASWSNLAQWPDDQAAREDLLNKAQTFSTTIKGTASSLNQIADRVGDQVAMQVDQANQLMKEIAELNTAINMHAVPGSNNPNSMMDERDQKVRELAALIDVDVIDKGYGDYIVNTKAGHTLVDGGVAFALEYRGAQAETYLSPGSSFNGNIQFGGSDGYEYTVKVTNGGGAGVATFNVSLDGGRTWISDDNGKPIEYTAQEGQDSIKVKDLDISFKFNGTDLSAGDTFHITPKPAVYWIEPTKGPMNISPQILPDGSENSRRMTGGAIAGNLIFRDYQVGPYLDQLDSWARTMIFEVNRIHSQGAGLTGLTYVLGDYKVRNIDDPLGSAEAGFAWSDKLQAGNFTVAIHDQEGRPVLNDPGLINGLASINFDPAVHSLEYVRDMINDSVGPSSGGTAYLTAEIVDGRLELAAGPGYTFGLTADTTGLLAGLGINTFFSGDSASTMNLNTNIVNDPNLINAGRVNGGAEFNAGDNQTAKEIADLVNKKVDFANWNGKTTSQTLSGYYSTLVSNVGGQTANAKFSFNTQMIKANELADRQAEISGVNLDEEMSNLIKFQASYKAAAKLITTADQMLQTLLSLKQ